MSWTEGIQVFLSVLSQNLFHLCILNHTSSDTNFVHFLMGRRAEILKEGNTARSAAITIL